MSRPIAAVLMLVLVAESSLLAVDAKKAAYFGGTVNIFSGADDPIEGRLDTSNEEALIFTAETKPHIGKSVSIPWVQVVDLEYGQKAGRRVGAAIGTTVLLGPIGLVSLFSKKRKHFLTVGFKDAEGKDQVAVLELGKDIVRTTLPIVSTRTGKEIEYQDDEAKKAPPACTPSLDTCGVYFGTTGGQVYASADAGDTRAPIVLDLPPVLSVEVQTIK